MTRLSCYRHLQGCLGVSGHWHCRSSSPGSSIPAAVLILRAFEDGALEVGAIEVDAAEGGAVKVAVVEVGTFEVGAVEVSAV